MPYLLAELGGGARLISRSNPGVHHADLTACNAFQCDPSTIQVPTLVIVGDADQMTPARSGRAVAAAIANSRLIGMEDDRVAFRWKDYRHGGGTKVMTLDAHEFIRRFLLHTLPDDFHRIRHYGFLANGHRATRLDLCRRLLARPQQDDLEPNAESAAVEPLAAAHRCPCCGGRMITIAIWRCGQAPPSPLWSDTS